MGSVSPADKVQGYRATHTRLVGACEDVFHTAGPSFLTMKRGQYVIICHRCKDVKRLIVKYSIDTTCQIYDPNYTTQSYGQSTNQSCGRAELRTNQTSVLVLPMRDGVRSVMEATDSY